MSMQTDSFPFPSQRQRETWVDHVLCVVVSLVFLVSAIAKSFSFRELEATLVASQLVPAPLTTFVGIFLLVLEYLLAFLLLVPPTQRSACYAAITVTSVFAAYSTWRWMQGIAVPCQCFGILFKMQPWQSLALNLGLYALILCILVRKNTQSNRNTA